MAYIGKKPEDKFRGLASYDTFTGDGSTTTFDVTNILPDGGTYDVEVFVDNVRQEGGAGKSYTIGNDGNGDLKRITFAVAPDNLSEIYVINPGRNTAVVTVTDNSLTAAKLQTDAVTTAKIEDSAVTNDKLAGSIANAKLANSSITINGTSIALGASGEIVAGTDWQAVTVADGSTTVNASAGEGYFLDTNAGVIEVFLPTSPTQGDTVILVDYAGTFATNNVIVNTGGVAIDSTVGSDFILSTNNRIAEFVYVDSNKGWLYKGATTKGSTPSQAGQPVYDTDAEYVSATGGTLLTVGDFKTHVFTGDGCFVVSSGGNPAGSDSVEYLVVAGGGGGGGLGTSGGNTTQAGGAGGAGGFRTYTTLACASPLNACSALPVSVTTYPITVGGGGAADPGNTCGGSPGSNSVFSTITSAGGGGGSSKNLPSGGKPGGSGGSGAGYYCGAGPNNYVAGTGNTPPTSPPQGNNGGAGANHGPAQTGSGGGGGAGAAGTSSTADDGFPGGNGSFVPDSFFGPTAPSYGQSPAPLAPNGRYFAGGGGGASSNTPGNPGIGGAGGGGTGADSAGPVSATAGGTNTGGGAGADGGPISGTGKQSGGSGIVVIRYKFQ